MATIKDKILVGDTYKLQYACTEPPQDDPDYQNYSFDKTPVTPTAVSVVLWDTQNGVYVNLADPNAPLDTPPTDPDVLPTEHPVPGDIAGNIVSYVIPGTVLNREGDFVAITSVTFADGQVVSVRRPFKVANKT